MQTLRETLTEATLDLLLKRKIALRRACKSKTNALKSTITTQHVSRDLSTQFNQPTQDNGCHRAYFQYYLYN